MTIVLSVSVVVCSSESFSPQELFLLGNGVSRSLPCLLVLVWYLRFDKILTQYKTLVRFSQKINIIHMMVILLLAVESRRNKRRLNILYSTTCLCFASIRNKRHCFEIHPLIFCNGIKNLQITSKLGGIFQRFFFVVLQK